VTITHDISTITLPDAPADQQAILDSGGVACWSEAVSIDTYEPGEPDRYPQFLDRRVYQGSSGRVYPIPFIDRIARTKKPRLWEAIHLENEFVRLMLLPEIGGRIHIGFDKTNGYDFFYRNNVIKPALVGLAGPWVSGGVEFNWPQHHRPGTFLPVETAIRRSDDGSVTVWHSDLDPLQRMQGTYGVRLRENSSLIEVDARLHNRTDEPQTFLWWANAAARCDTGYQSFFPTDVDFVADHARRAISAFPKADRPYYGVDYPALVSPENPRADRLDLYANIPVPTSYMITETRGEFFGGYDHGKNAGFVHWADRSVAPGKKQWTWGNGAVGQAWDDQLTDTDGPYVELMAGVFTDNQPDFSWLAAGETRRFSQYWYPIRDIGPAQQATTDVAVSLTLGNEADGRVTAHLGAAATREFTDARVQLRSGSLQLAEWRATLSPATPFLVSFELPGTTGPDDLSVRVLHDDRVLISWANTIRDGHSAEPAAATEPAAPAAILSSDELFLTGIHLTQYRHPTRSPLPYFQEILRRDPGDSRALIALGTWHYRLGGYAEARTCFESALARLTGRNLNPQSGEASYRLGLVLERTGHLGEAADHFAKAAWDAAWSHPATLAVARIRARQGRLQEALDHADAARRTNVDSPEAELLAVVSLRALGRYREADQRVRAARDRDPLDPVYLALDGKLSPQDPKTLLAVAIQFARAGAGKTAVDLATRAAQSPRSAFGNTAPLAHYLIAQWFERDGASALAATERRAARGADATLAFPYGLDEYDALVAAIAHDNTDALAHGLLGAWLIDAGLISDARRHLEEAVALGSADPVVWRNAAITLVNTGGDRATAAALFSHALTLSPDDARIVYERDQLAQLAGTASAESRIDAIERHPTSITERDDLALVYVNLLVDVDRIDDALLLLSGRSFRPFEGGEGRAIAAYDRATLARAHGLLPDDPAAAAELARAGFAAPANLGEGRHPSERLAERSVILGDALRLLGNAADADHAYVQATSTTPFCVTDRPTELDDFWIGIAHVRLGQSAEAEAIWNSLDRRADDILRHPGTIDYFATSLPELLLFDTDTADSRIRLASLFAERARTGRELRAAATPAGVLR